MALAVLGDRLFSASDDCTIQMWTFGTCASLRTLQACRWGTGLHPHCLAVSGSHLIAGLHGQVLVWGLETLALQHTLLQPAGEHVRVLLAVERGVWAGVGRDVVWWGRRGA